MPQYKNTGVDVAESSACGQAIKNKKPKEAETLFIETTNRYKRQYPAKHRAWFDSFSNTEPAKLPYLTGEEFDSVTIGIYQLRLLNYSLLCKYHLMDGMYVMEHPPAHPLNGKHDVRSLREALTQVRCSLMYTLDNDHATGIDRMMVRNAPFWKIATLLY